MQHHVIYGKLFHGGNPWQLRLSPYNLTVKMFVSSSSIDLPARASSWPNIRNLSYQQGRESRTSTRINKIKTSP